MPSKLKAMAHKLPLSKYHLLQIIFIGLILTWIVM